MRFSQRMGIQATPDAIQVDGMNDELRAGLWNVLLTEEFDRTGFVYAYNGNAPRIGKFSAALWSDYFKLPIDERPNRNTQTLAQIREHFFGCSWHKVYDFIEFCVGYHGDRFIKPLNRILERELSGYRLIGGVVAPISSPEEVETIREAIGDPIFPGASAHLRTALDLLSQKTNPDYRNSIKEAISAVESVSCAITGTPSSTLGQALKEMSKTHSLHGALKEGFLKLYGYTSNEDGIRHAMLDEPKLTQSDAVYFLVSCSAFVNYLKMKSTE